MYVEQRADSSFSQACKCFWRCLLHIGNRSICIETGEVFLNSFEFRCKCYEHNEGSLTMANIVYLLLSYFIDIFERCGDIIFCHLMEGKIPKIKNYWTERFTTISISSRVSYPNIKAFICVIKSWGKSWIIDDPCVRRIDEAMLK